MKNIYINYNLVFDYNSILFCALRSYLLPLGFNIQNSTRSLYELKSPQQAYNSIPNDSKNELCKPEDFLELFRKYFTSIKPTIAAIDTSKKNKGVVVVLYLLRFSDFSFLTLWFYFLIFCSDVSKGSREQSNPLL